MLNSEVQYHLPYKMCHELEPRTVTLMVNERPAVHLQNKWSSTVLTVVVCVQFGFQLLHLPLVSQQRPVFLQCAHPVLLLLLHRLLDQRVLLIVCDAWNENGKKVSLC